MTRLRRVRIALTDPPESFRLGATVTAKLGKEQSPILRVPTSAVLAKDGAKFVWVVDQPASTVSLHKVDLTEDPAGRPRHRRACPRCAHRNRRDPQP